MVCFADTDGKLEIFLVSFLTATVKAIVFQ